MPTISTKGKHLSSFAGRLKGKRERLQLSQTEFAALADSSKASQINYESGKRAPDSEYLEKIAASSVDIYYLFSGIKSNHPILKLAGKMKPLIAPAEALLSRPEVRFAIETTDRLRAQGVDFEDKRPAIQTPQVSPDDFVYIRRYDVNLSAGPGMIPVENAEADQLAFSRAWMLREGLNGQRCGLLRVRGDSMHPTIHDGAMVLVEMSDEPIKREGIYAFSRDNEAFVKRVIPINTGKDGRATSLVILSDNSAYHPDVLVGEKLNDIRIVGRVRCSLTTL